LCPGAGSLQKYLYQQGCRKSQSRQQSQGAALNNRLATGMEAIASAIIAIAIAIAIASAPLT
jgi:hypothetical protein